MNTLGIDYGLKHVGIAISSGPLAEPLCSVTTDNFIFQLSDIVKKHRIEAIIFGMPEGEMAPKILEIIHLLRHKYLPPAVSVITQDETLSSHDAIHSLLHTSVSKRHHKEHSVAAALILQSWLDSQSHSL